MFRENVLVNRQVIDLLSKTMVPVALDYQKVLDRDSPEARLLLPLMNAKGKGTGNGKRGSDRQGVWIFSPEGKVLGRFTGFGDMVGRTKRMIEGALEAFGPVERRTAAAKTDPHRDRGKGFRPDGSVRLAEYVRRRDRDRIRSPVISSVILSPEEFGAFAPRKAVEGHAWTLPDAVAKKLCRVASPMCYQHAPQPHWVRDVAIEARVEAVRSGVAELTYEGRISSRRLMRDGKVLSAQELALRGEGRYDISRGGMRSLRLVGSGTFRWPEEAPDRPVPFDALIEWESAPVSRTTLR